jgi:hypothetical protein
MGTEIETVAHQSTHLGCGCSRPPSGLDRLVPIARDGESGQSRCSASFCLSGHCHVPDEFDQLAAAEIAVLFEER